MPLIRNLAVGLLVRDGYVLVSGATDSVKGEAFYRAIGGGIEFGETADGAVRREFEEELGVALQKTQLLGVLENIFEYEAVAGHEIVHVFAVTAKELDVIPIDAELHILDEGSPVYWKRINDIDRPLYPDGALQMVLSQARPTRDESSDLPFRKSQ
ncbi:NUDIX domain-containing protein [Pseudarthrobacter sp. TAF60_1]|uniref:NUDIX domain-containing protein n=1 Tax=Pseudarthrobacter sp. TAF60_1 TaxID=3233071 RepID=UPI003F9CD244